MYNSLASEKYNERTIELLENDPFCQVIIATKVGIHAETLVDSISIGTSDTQDDSKQNVYTHINDRQCIRVCLGETKF